MACSFEMCSIFTDVQETIKTLPKEPKELKTVLMAHLGITDIMPCCAGENLDELLLKPNTTTNVAAISTPMSEVFKHPITYIDASKLHELPSSIIDDLEMISTKPKLSTSTNDYEIDGLYHYVFKPTSVYGNEYLPIWSKYYTTDIEYLKHTQTLLKIYDHEILTRAILQNTSNKTHVEAFSTMKDTWKSFRGSGKIQDFKEKFSYVETPILSKLNNSSPFLQFLTVYNMSSPVIALLTPIIVIIVPFIVLLMRGTQISVNDYIEILKTIISQHAIGKLFTSFDTVSPEQKMYMLMSVIFYFIQIYQNVMACIRFYNNIKLVHTHLNTINGFLTVTGVNMSYIIQLIQTYHLSTYDGFKNELVERYTLLSEFTRALSDITPFSPSVSKFLQIGFVMKNYYALFSQTDLNELLDYSFGFNAYIEHLSACRSLVIDETLNECKFVQTALVDAATKNDNETESEESEKDELPPPYSPSKHGIADEDDTPVAPEATPEATPDATTPDATPDESKLTIKKQEHPNTSTQIISQLYAPLLSNKTTNSPPIPNDIFLDKQLIITGPNAAGKTTIIKATLFNIILSQQIGYGFYKSAQINPYKYLHCYLNIPDTSGRDSLFQAESRRCKEILNCILEHPNDRHFCIFDELYSGTNPYEAIASAYGYIDFISKKSNIDLILTTHYIELCDLLEKHQRIANLHMSTSSEGVYLYKIAEGISTIKGGLKVLRDLDYPAEIVDNARMIIERK